MIWNHDTPVAIYGAAHAGIRVYNKLKETCNLTAFIDKRAEDISYVNGSPVYRIESSFFTALNKDRLIIIVCVTNIFDHENIVVDLLKHNFKFIIFSPVDESHFEYRSKDEKKYRKELYELVCNGNLQLPLNIDHTQGLFHLSYRDTAVLAKNNQLITANIPSFFAFTRKIGNGNWQNTPILTLFTHLAIFNLFSGNPDSSSRYYIDLYCHGAAKETGVKTSKSWERNIIASRKMVYERMRMAEDISPLFFIEHAVPGTWNAEGHINMVSGKHRAAYLIHRHRVMIPLVLSEADYQIFLNNSTALKLSEYCRTHDLYELPYPVYHPLFYSIPFAYDAAYYELLLKLSHWLAVNMYEDKRKFHLNGLSIYDMTAGDFLPLLLSLGVFGCKIETVYPISEFDEIVSQLYHLSEAPKYNACPKKYYDLVFTNCADGEMLTGADYFVLMVDEAKYMDIVASNTIIGLKILHYFKDNLIAVGKRKPSL